MTFDTGALIALERNKQRVLQIFQNTFRRGEDITAPAAVIAECRARCTVQSRVLIRNCSAKFQIFGPS